MQTQGWGKGKGSGWGDGSWDGWNGDWSGMMGGFGGGGGGSKGGVIGKPWGGIQENQAMCSIHHKLRKLQYLEDQGSGRFVCVAGSQCQSAGPPSVKKTICKFFQEGTCNRGASCAFAHSEEEIGQPIPEEAAELMAESVKAKNSLPGWTEEPPEKALCSIHNKMRSVTCLQATDDGSGTFFCKPGAECKGSSLKELPCKFFVQGKCTKGEECPFLHDESQIGMELPPEITGKGKGKGWDKGWGKGWEKGGKMDMWNPMMMMMMKGGFDWWGGGGGYGPSYRGGGSNGKAAGEVQCSVHNKTRKKSYCMEDGSGGFCCMPGFECQGAGGKGAPRVSPY